MIEWQVSERENGISVLRFLKEKLPHYSTRQLKAALDAGRCAVNGRAERFGSSLVGKGDQIKLEMLVEGKEALLFLDSSRILFSDECLIAYNKPAGLVSNDKKLLEWMKGAVLVHRLDRDTSGVLLFARTAVSEKALLQQFQQREVQKVYLALVDGILQKRAGIIENYLGKRCLYQGQTLWGAVPAAKGLYAKTCWELLQAGKQAALLQCRPETGRTHQIRVHLSEMGHPILGDRQYGKVWQCAYRPPRLMLHASQLAFTHPLSGNRVVLTAPMPEDFQAAVEVVIG